MSKKQSGTDGASKQTASRESVKKFTENARSHAQDKEVSSIVNTHPAPKKPDSKD